MSATDWLDNEALFVAELQTGHRYAQSVAVSLTEAGIVAEVSPLTIREDVADRHGYHDEHDLTVYRPLRVEVKSRRVHFTGPHDYPYPTALVYSRRGWDAKMHKPVAIVLVSQFTGGHAVIPTSTEPDWLVVDRYDNVRGFTDTFYELPVERLATFEAFVAWLKR